MLARIDVRTTELHSPWQNKNKKVRRRRVQSNIPNMVWDFFMVYKSDIYSHTAVKYGIPALERLTGDTRHVPQKLLQKWTFIGVCTA